MTDYTDIIIKKLSESSALEEYPIDSDLRKKEVTLQTGKCSIETFVYKSEKLEKACFSKVSIKKVRSHVGTVYPSDDFDFPIFGYDLEDYGDKLLAIVDLKPLRRQDKSYCDKYIDPLREVYEKYKDIIGGELKTTWTKEFVSGYGLWGRGSKDYVDKLRSAFLDYLNLYIKFIKDATPIEDKKIREESLKFKTYCRNTYYENDPGRGPMNKFFGEEYGERYLRLLF